jgi:DNA-directed RNA polymerase subunit M/transcription elongation factor TFIIS
MLTFTSDTAGPHHPVNPPGSCPRCQNSGAVEVSLRTERVVFYRCSDCGHMWVVKPAQPAA